MTLDGHSEWTAQGMEGHVHVLLPSAPHLGPLLREVCMQTEAEVSCGLGEPTPGRPAHCAVTSALAWGRSQATSSSSLV